MLIDVDSGQTTPLLDAGRRTFGQGAWGSVITSQAWAPDNRRLVYMNDHGRVIVLDTATRQEEDLGPGEEPTWSPDGRYIAIQKPPARDELATDKGDFLLVTLDKPAERTLLLSNRTTVTKTAYYYGPAIWSPDSRFLVIWQSEGEIEHPYVLERTTGEIAKMPHGYWGRSWGGKP
jgi:Tol biopolymer transport system component